MIYYSAARTATPHSGAWPVLRRPAVLWLCGNPRPQPDPQIASLDKCKIYRVLLDTPVLLNFLGCGVGLRQSTAACVAYRPFSDLLRQSRPDGTRAAFFHQFVGAKKPTASVVDWVFITGGCSGRGVQWIGVVLYNKPVYNIISITTPCFHCTPPLMNLDGRALCALSRALTAACPMGAALIV